MGSLWTFKKQQKPPPTTIKWLHTAHLTESRCPEALRNWFQGQHLHPLHKVELMHPLQTGCTLKPLALQLQWRFQCTNNLFSNQVRSAEILEAWIAWSLFLLFFLRHNRSLHLLKLFRRMLQRCFAIKLQKYYVHCKTSAFSLIWRSR